MVPEYQVIRTVPKGYSGPRIIRWDRQTGKTQVCIDWWLEDPFGRVIITHNVVAADDLKRRIVTTACEYLMKPDYLADIRELLNTRILSIGNWYKACEGLSSSIEIAIDNLHLIGTSALALITVRGHNIRLITTDG